MVPNHPNPPPSVVPKASPIPLEYAGPARAPNGPAINNWLVIAALPMIVLGAVIVILSAFTASVIPGIGGIAMLLAEYVTLGQRRPTGAFLVTIIAGLLSAGCLLSVLTSDGDFPPRDVLSGLGSALFAAIALVHGVWAWRATPKRRRRYKT